MKRAKAETLHASAEFGSSETFRLTRAVLLYEGNHRAYATLHDIVGKDGPQRLGPGFPASRAALVDIVKALGRDNAWAGFVHPRALYIGHGSIVWWMPGTQRRVWFKCGKHEEDGQCRVEIGERSAVTPHPDLVFARTARTWSVFALRTAGVRPEPTTRLYQAPYFNVYDHGGICEGNVHPPAIDRADSIEACERIFFETRFTHPNADHLANWKGGAWALWSELLDGRHKAFPPAALVDLKLTLSALPKRLQEGRRD